MSALPGEDPRLRTAEQFIAAERNQVRAGVDALGDQRFVDAERPEVGNAAAAQILINGDAALAPERRQIAQTGPRGESGDPEVAGMDAQEQARALADRVPVIVDVGAIGRADLAQDGARARHDIGNAEAVADLDQLPAGDDHLSSGGEFVEREKDRRGVVVDGNPGRADQPLQQAGQVNVALAALARREVVLEVEYPGIGPSAPERRASEIGVQDDAGGIDDAPQRRPFQLRECRPRPAPRWADSRMRPAAISERTAASARRISATTMACGYRARAGREAIENFMHGRQIAEFERIGTISMVPRLCRTGARDYTRNFGAWLSLARAPGSGPGGRWFESTRPDQIPHLNQSLTGSRFLTLTTSKKRFALFLPFSCNGQIGYPSGPRPRVKTHDQSSPDVRGAVSTARSRRLGCPGSVRVCPVISTELLWCSRTANTKRSNLKRLRCDGFAQPNILIPKQTALAISLNTEQIFIILSTERLAKRGVKLFWAFRIRRLSPLFWRANCRGSFQGTDFSCAAEI